MLRVTLLVLLIAGASLAGFTMPASAEPVEEVQLQVLIFNDLDQSGIQEEGEPGLADIELILQNGDQTLTVVTDETGLFSTPVQPGVWLITLPQDSLWAPVHLESMQVEITGEAATAIFSLALMAIQEEPTATPELEGTETLEQGTPEATSEPLFVEEVEDGVQLPVILPVSGVSLAPSVAWGLGFGLLIVIGAALIIIGRRGGRL